ncbi:hypothetical protein L6452_36912 [Arctium lappa]|uniref:Uncharacterized protein n=1 Tax=Arctium lappa TaxID=4217 RepID=A0ACB8Y1I5_ARCLA|nr:hypothetical protein L6452_36912 [Arctium lappa]
MEKYDLPIIYSKILFTKTCTTGNDSIQQSRKRNSANENAIRYSIPERHDHHTCELRLSSMTISSFSSPRKTRTLSQIQAQWRLE